MSGRGSSHGAKFHKNYILCSSRSALNQPDTLDIFIIRTTTTHPCPVSIIVSGDVFPNTLARVTGLYENHAEENTTVSNRLKRSHDF